MKTPQEFVKDASRRTEQALTEFCRLADNHQQKALADELEALVDKHTLTHVLVGLELICAEKAEHVRVNWQDRSTAGNWNRAARVCYAAARKVTV